MKQVATVRGELDEQKADIAQQKFQNEFDRCMTLILKAHPDYYELAQDELFVDWIQTQPKKIRSAFEPELDIDELEDAADTVSYAIKLFKMEHKVPVKEKKSDDNREAARDVVRRSKVAPEGDVPGKFSESQIERMSLKEYEKNEKEILKAMSEGRIVYDLSGAAR